MSKKTCIIGNSTSGIDANEDISKGVDKDGNQTFETDEMKWRIWDYDKNTKTIRIISEKPTSKNLILKGATGYNNGVYAINEVCRKCYSNEEKGVEVSNLKKSDIQKVIKYDYTKYVQNSYQYGDGKPYKNATYPKIWEECDSKWKYERKSDGTIIGESDKEGLIWESENNYKNEDGTKTESNDTIFKQSYWLYNYNENTEIWTNAKYYDLLTKDGEGTKFGKYSWLADRYTYLRDNCCDFGIQTIYTLIGGNALYYTERKTT